MLDGYLAAIDAFEDFLRLRAFEAAVGELLSANGCDCGCDHSNEEHGADCERCLACKIQGTLDTLDADRKDT